MTVNVISIVQNVIQIKNRVKMLVNVSVKSITRAKNSWYLKGIFDDSRIIVCDKIMKVIDSGSRNLANNKTKNVTIVTNTVSINFDDKTVRYKMKCYILHMFFLVAILLFIIGIFCYHYAKDRSKQKNIGTVNKKKKLRKLIITKFFHGMILLRFCKIKVVAEETHVEKKNNKNLGC